MIATMWARIKQLPGDLLLIVCLFLAAASVPSRIDT